MRTKKQHFIPQGYLKLFSSDQRSIWVWDKKTNEIRLQKIEGTGTLKNFYSSKIKADPLDNSPVPELEGAAISVIRKIERNDKLQLEELRPLLTFITLQFLRTPAMRDRLEAVFKKFWENVRLSYQSKNLKVKREAERTAESFVAEQKLSSTSPINILTGRVAPQYPSEDFIRTMSWHGFGFSKKLLDQKWEFLHAGTEKSSEFATSDDPFVVNEAQGIRLLPSLGHGVLKLMPLSKKLCMCISGEKFSIIKKQMLPWAVKVMNLGIADYAQRYVYASRRDILEEFKNPTLVLEKIKHNLK